MNIRTMTSTFPMAVVCFLACCVALVALVSSAAAQIPPDSVAALTEAVRSGDLLDRADAVGVLAAQDVSALPNATQDALIKELRRLHGAFMEGEHVEGAQDLGHGFGEYYLALAVAVAQLNSPAGNRALTGSVAASIHNTGDPAFLPLARYFHERLASLGDRLSASMIEHRAIAALGATAGDLPVRELATRVLRQVESVCVSVERGPRQGVCRPLQNHMAAAVERLERGQERSAQAQLDAAAREADQALDRELLGAAEHALIAGGARQVLERLR